MGKEDILSWQYGFEITEHKWLFSPLHTRSVGHDPTDSTSCSLRYADTFSESSE